MTAQLQLANVRNELIRLEETIIFGMIERSQFRRNDPLYKPGAFGDALGEESLMDFLLHESERTYAKVRRYTSPDEHPFFADLPAPLLPSLQYENNPLVPNTINHNERIRQVYVEELVPLICLPGDDMQYGSSAVADVLLLQAISKRVHYGKFVAECKYRSGPAAFDEAIRQHDAGRLFALITLPDVEEKVLERVSNKTRLYTSELDALPDAAFVTPEKASRVYSDWIMPLNKEIQVEYLLLRRA